MLAPAVHRQAHGFKKGPNKNLPTAISKTLNILVTRMIPHAFA